MVPQVKILVRNRELVWHNLVTWCKHVWEGRSLIYHPHENMNMMQTVVSAAHHITCRYREKSWEECMEALDGMKERSHDLDIEWK